jgi:erythromycin esterase
MTSIWQTKEIADLLTWIKAYNKNHKDKVIISGFDTNALANNVTILKKAVLQKKNIQSWLQNLIKKQISRMRCGKSRMILLSDWI